MNKYIKRKPLERSPEENERFHGKIGNPSLITQVKTKNLSNKQFKNPKS